MIDLPAVLRPRTPLVHFESECSYLFESSTEVTVPVEWLAEVK